MSAGPSAGSSAGSSAGLLGAAKEPRGFAIVPAAGHSVRMGRPKLLLPWGETTVLDHTLAAWRRTRVAAIAVVVRSEDAALQTEVRRQPVDLVVPDTPPPEMRDSILAALRHLRAVYQPTDADAWLLAPADMPWLSTEVTNSLLACHDPSRPRILIPTYQGERGHPVLFPWTLAAEVERLAPREGVNCLRERFGWTPFPVSNPFVHGDLDTPADYERLRPR